MKRLALALPFTVLFHSQSVWSSTIEDPQEKIALAHHWIHTPIKIHIHDLSNQVSLRFSHSSSSNFQPILIDNSKFPYGLIEELQELPANIDISQERQRLENNRNSSNAIFDLQELEESIEGPPEVSSITDSSEESQRAGNKSNSNNTKFYFQGLQNTAYTNEVDPVTTEPRLALVPYENLFDQPLVIEAVEEKPNIRVRHRSHFMTLYLFSFNNNFKLTIHAHVEGYPEIPYFFNFQKIIQSKTVNSSSKSKLDKKYSSDHAVANLHLMLTKIKDQVSIPFLVFDENPYPKKPDLEKYSLEKFQGRGGSASHK